MGPGLGTGLGGPSRTARAAARAQVCPRTRMPMPASPHPMCHAPILMRALLRSAGFASGDVADTAADSADPGVIVIAGKVARLLYCHASYVHLSRVLVSRVRAPEACRGCCCARAAHVFVRGAVGGCSGCPWGCVAPIAKDGTFVSRHTCRPLVSPGAHRERGVNKTFTPRNGTLNHAVFCLSLLFLHHMGPYFTPKSLVEVKMATPPRPAPTVRPH